jgi:hypothetical protein
LKGCPRSFNKPRAANSTAIARRLSFLPFGFLRASAFLGIIFSFASPQTARKGARGAFRENRSGSALAKAPVRAFDALQDRLYETVAADRGGRCSGPLIYLAAANAPHSRPSVHISRISGRRNLSEKRSFLRRVGESEKRCPKTGYPSLRTHS